MTRSLLIDDQPSVVAPVEEWTAWRDRLKGLSQADDNVRDALLLADRIIAEDEHQPG